ncbi:MAG: hypothetical protein FWH12_06345 [Treponema sp.]|nr:hypothetical protein [Treponema sp.]
MNFMEKMKADWKEANKFYKENKEAVDKIHENKILTFTFLCDGGPSTASTRKIHKSQSHNRKQASEYRLGIIEGRMAFLRTSNHWGTFFSKNEMHVWELEGAPRKADGSYKNTSQTGFLFIEGVENV